VLPEDTIIAECLAEMAVEEDLSPCLVTAWLQTMHARLPLKALGAALRRTEALVHEQPVSPDDFARLVPRMQAMQACLRELQPVVDGWAESEVCLKATRRGEQRRRGSHE
jgi:hypothetical protein